MQLQFNQNHFHTLPFLANISLILHYEMEYNRFDNNQLNESQYDDGIARYSMC
jgi:hypothetical protein